jgi:hypothetical protein
MIKETEKMRLYKIIKIGDADAYYKDRKHYEGKYFYGETDVWFKEQATGYLILEDTLQHITFHQVELHYALED